MRTAFSIAGCLVAMVALLQATATAQVLVLPAPPPSPVASADAAPQRSWVDRDPSAITPAELVGVWSPDNNCVSSVVEFFADGAYVDAGSRGTWTIVGDTLVQTFENGQVRENHINPLNADTYALSASADAVVSIIFMRCAN